MDQEQNIAINKPIAFVLASFGIVNSNGCSIKRERKN